MPNTPQDILLAALLQLAREKHFVEYVIGLRKGKDNVELANIAVVLIHLLHIAVNDFECDQFIVLRGATSDEKKGGISSVYYLGIYPKADLAVEAFQSSIPRRDTATHLCIRESCTCECVVPKQAATHPLQSWLYLWETES